MIKPFGLFQEDRVFFKLPQPSAFHSAIISEDKLWVIPGSSSISGDSDISGGLWSLDLNERSLGWDLHPPCPGGQRVQPYFVNAKLGDGSESLFVFGGRQSGEGILQDSWRYVPDEREWRSLADLPRRLAGGGVFSAGPSHILLLPNLGGYFYYLILTFKFKSSC